MSWKDLFAFGREERREVLLLAVLIAAVYALPWMVKQCQASQQERADVDQALEEYEQFVASLQPESDTDAPATESPSPLLFPFDPNTSDSLTLRSLGLSPRIVRNILRYRSRQGKFRRPEDFGKLYGLTEDQYRTLRPYIRIAPQEPERLPTQTDSLRPSLLIATRRDTLHKYAPGTVVELNGADTTTLKKIPGIGSATARSIVSYRQQLGGYYRIEQLQEIRLKAELLRPWLRIDTTSIRRIDINKASVERLMNHPYLNFYQAKAIDTHRKKKGKIANLERLALYEEFGSEQLDRLRPYICYE